MEQVGQARHSISAALGIVFRTVCGVAKIRKYTDNCYFVPISPQNIYAVDAHYEESTSQVIWAQLF